MLQLQSIFFYNSLLAWTAFVGTMSYITCEPLAEKINPAYSVSAEEVIPRTDAQRMVQKDI